MVIRHDVGTTSKGILPDNDTHAPSRPQGHWARQVFRVSSSTLEKLKFLRITITLKEVLRWELIEKIRESL
jgi:hypothetical protein